MRHKILPAGYVLLAGDLIAFLLFAYYGKLAHHLPVTILGILDTLAPFLAGWMVAILVFRTYRERAYSSFGLLLLSTLFTWTLAAPIGLVVRVWWTGIPMTWTFTWVAYVITLAFLLGWRILFAIGYEVSRRYASKLA
ncbi:DUF3054 domain-containing protein [Brevibacillus choshinensis]|uniref:DUF3054 domain-containing protein n=1 Tax=Brevibacillus choshinensis TaxID=54911 RepID=A0ABX7FJ43_BRECH|nr:DUF3054 domain-containing protein [Brevibacillus choshinensis]QRG65302.1 DUF3054 domain-containing protein [Brevibacillus choshinensis]